MDDQQKVTCGPSNGAILVTYWPWTTSNSYFKVTSLFDVKYLRNGARYRHSYNELLMGIYARLKNVVYDFDINNNNNFEW